MSKVIITIIFYIILIVIIPGLLYMFMEKFFLNRNKNIKNISLKKSEKTVDEKINQITDQISTNSCLNQYEQNVYNFILRYDPYFNVEKFKVSAKICLCNVLNMCIKSEINYLIPVLDVSLYKNLNLISEIGNENNYQIIHFVRGCSNITFNEVFELDENIVLRCTATLTTNKIIINPNTKEIINYDDTFVIQKKYVTFYKNKNSKTTSGIDFIVDTCPNCGAKMELNNIGTCEYCKSNLINGNYSWVISKINDYTF